MQSSSTPMQILANLHAFEDDLLSHIHHMLSHVETDPFMLCACEFIDQALRIKNENVDHRLIGSCVYHKLDLLHTLYVNQPIAIIRISIRVFAMQADCDLVAISTITNKCLKSLAHSSNKIELGDFQPSVDVYKLPAVHRSLLVPIQAMLLDDDPFAGVFHCHSRDPTICSTWRVLVGMAGTRHIRGAYLRCKGPQDAPCYMSEDNSFMLLQRKIVPDSSSEDKITFYSWNIIHFISKAVHYTCCTDKSSEVPPGYGWRLGSHGLHPAPVLSFTPATPLDNDSTPDPVQSFRGEMNPAAFLAPVGFGNRSGVDDILCKTFRPKRIRTSRIASIADPASESEPFLTSEIEKCSEDVFKHNSDDIIFGIPADSNFTPYRAYPTPDSEAALHTQLDELHAKSLWVKEASTTDICVGYTDDIVTAAAMKDEPDNTYFNNWSVDNLLKIRFLQKMRTLAFTSCQQLNSYVYSMNFLISSEEKYNSTVITLGTEIIGSQDKQQLVYVVCINIANFTSASRLSEKASAAHKALQEINSRAEKNEYDDDINDGEIGMGCVEEVITRHSDHDFNAASEALRNVGRDMNASVSESILAKIGLDSQKMFTLRKDLSSLCSFHAALVELCARHSLRELPAFPDPFEIGLVEESVHSAHKSAFTSEKETSIGIKFAKQCFPAAQSNINDMQHALDTEQLLQGCMLQIQNYMQNIFTYIESLGRAHTTDSEVIDVIDKLFAKFVLAPFDASLVIPLGHADVCSMSNKRSAYLRNSRRGLPLEVLIKDTGEVASSDKSDAELLELQNYRCRGCGHGLHVIEVFGVFQHSQNYRRCHYFNALFCKRWCHYGEKHALPLKLITQLDTAKYSVSCHAARFLQSLWDKPLIQVSLLSPSIFAEVPIFVTIQNLRLAIMKRMDDILIFNKMPFDRALESTIGLKRMYMCLTPDLFALNDIENAHLYMQLEVDLKSLLEMLDIVP